MHHNKRHRKLVVWQCITLIEMLYNLFIYPIKALEILNKIYKYKSIKIVTTDLVNKTIWATGIELRKS